jgi:hypothetical protein
MWLLLCRLWQAAAAASTVNHAVINLLCADGIA